MTASMTTKGGMVVISPPPPPMGGIAKKMLVHVHGMADTVCLSVSRCMLKTVSTQASGHPATLMERQMRV